MFYHRWTFPHLENLPPRLVRLSKQRYDLTVLCGDEIPYEQDGTRESAAFRARQQADYITYLKTLNTYWIEAKGNLTQRIDKIVAALEK